VRTRPYRFALYSQLSLLVFLGVCVVLHPGLVLKWNEAGLSNYGIHITTAIPYTLAFALSSAFAVQAVRVTVARNRATRVLRVVLYAYALLCLFVLASTYGYSRTPPLHHVHVVAGITLMLFEPVASLWCYLQVRTTRHAAWWLGVEAAGFALAVIDYEVVLHVLFLAQLFTGVGFGVLMVRTVGRLSSS